MCSKMGSPIQVLFGNIVHTFENANESALSLHKKVTTSGLVAKEINYDNSCDKVKTPHSDIKTREIYLQETYLSHLWAFIYSIFVIYEEGVQKPFINKTFKGEIEFSTPILKRAKYLYDWSISLAEEYSEWDESLPNPRKHHSEEERFYAEKVNGIFQTSVAYVMFHEYAHLIQGHESYFLGSKLCEMTDIEFADRIQIENEADDYAFNMIVKNDDGDKERLIKGLSILLVTCSSLLLTTNVDLIKQRTHPDLDNRMLSLLHKLNLSTEKSEFYGWYLCVMAIRFFLIKHNIYIENKEYETAKDAFFSYLDIFDDIKESKCI